MRVGIFLEIYRRNSCILKSIQLHSLAALFLLVFTKDDFITQKNEKIRKFEEF